MGSVGLIALYIALFLQKNGHKILFSGLDFSYSEGFTHSRGSPSTQTIHRQSTRLSPVGSAIGSFSDARIIQKGKNNTIVYTDPNLLGYAKLCSTIFESNKNLIDVGETGLITCGKMMGAKEAFSLLDKKLDSYKQESIHEHRVPRNGIEKWLSEEKAKLIRLKALLTGVAKSDNQENEIKNILNSSEYLYLHFPDGYREPSTDSGFLKRVRIELEYALKTLNFPLF